MNVTTTSEPFHFSNVLHFNFPVVITTFSVIYMSAQISRDTASDAMVLSSESKSDTPNDSNNACDFASFLAQFSFQPSDFPGESSNEVDT